MDGSSSPSSGASVEVYPRLSNMSTENNLYLAEHQGINEVDVVVNKTRNQTTQESLTTSILHILYILRRGQTLCFTFVSCTTRSSVMIPSILALWKKKSTSTKAVYLAEHQGINVVDDVLNKIHNQTTQENLTTSISIFFQSTDKSVLIAFNEKTIIIPGQLMYRVDKDIQNVTDSAINAILSFAGTIVISMNSVLPYNRGGLVRLKKADVVPRLKVRGVRVFVNTFSNEFVTQPLDLFSDSTVEVDFFFQTAKIDGIITELRVTSARYKSKTKKNQCYRETGLFRTGELLPFANPMLLSPAQPPYPLLVKSDVKESSLPEVRSKQPPPSYAASKAVAKAMQVYSPFKTIVVLIVIWQWISLINVPAKETSSLGRTAVITGLVQNELHEDGLRLFSLMRRGLVHPYSVTYLSALSACSGSQRKLGIESDLRIESMLMDMYSKCGSHEDAWKIFESAQETDENALQDVLGVSFVDNSLGLDKQLHFLVIKRGFSGNTFVNNRLINMYSKCGDVDDSLSVFRRMSERNYVSWNSMIASFARHGHRLAALKLYKEMISQDVNPIDQEPKTCIVDMLGRAGHLEEAKSLVLCSFYGDTQIGRYAAEQLFQSSPDSSALHILMAHIYSYRVQGKERERRRSRE
ncbi:hypothetical protein YC2023_024834 [Brassica napus]